jgi:2-dehydro-3-deoxygluconokinase
MSFEVCKEAVEAASSKGLTISVDLNYRAKLWQYGASPDEVMPELVSHCNLVWEISGLLKNCWESIV